MGQTYLDADGNPLKATGAYLDDEGKVKGPKTGGDTKPHPEATIGPDVGSLTSPQHDGVTLGELIDHPVNAIKKMVQIQATALSNPRVSIPLAIGAAAGVMGLGPRSFAGTRGLAEPAPTPAIAASSPSRLQAVVQAVKQNPDAAIDALPLGRTVKGAAKLARAYQQIRTPAGSPAEAVPAPVSTPGAAPPPTPTAPPAPAASAAPPAESAPSEGAMPSLAELQLTPAEITTAVKWHESGVKPEVILHRILQSRQLTARTGTQTPDQAAEAVRYRNEKGRWQDER